VRDADDRQLERARIAREDVLDLDAITQATVRFMQEATIPQYCIELIGAQYAVPRTPLVGCLGL
jgi:hypothetical protein